jgi:hypothetical protein
MAKFSTGLRSHVLATGSVVAALGGGRLKYFTGAPPVSADAAETGTLLTTLTVNADGTTGLTFDAPADGVMSKAAAEQWQGVNAATGTAGYARFVAAADTGGTSTTEPRIQMTVGTVGTDLLLANTLLTTGQTFTLNYFNVALPTL